MRLRPRRGRWQACLRSADPVSDRPLWCVFARAGLDVGGVLLICGELQKRNKFQSKRPILSARARSGTSRAAHTRAARRKVMAPDGPENAPPAISKRKADHLALCA